MTFSADKMIASLKANRSKRAKAHWNRSTDKAKDCRARRAAQKAGLIARKTRWRKDSCENEGHFMLVDASTNLPVAGFRYDMSAAEVMLYCKRGAP